MTVTIPKVLVIIKDNNTMQYEHNNISKATMLYYNLIISLGLNAYSALNTKALTLPGKHFFKFSLMSTT